MSSPAPEPISYAEFVRDIFAAEHRHPANIALHVAGTIGGLALLAAAAIGQIALWWALAFPLVHVGPGLIGHRLFERNSAVGDVRLTRADYPLWWFVRANHRMTVQVLTGRFSS